VTLSDDEKLEMVRTAIDAFNRRDTEAMIALGNDHFEYDWTRSLGLNRRVYRGDDGFREFITDQWTTFDEMRIEPSEIVPCGDHVLVVAVTHSRGRQGVAVTAKSTQLYTFDDDRLARVTLYQDREEAVAAARE
jgi:ketosteroid isomerase-like protein